MEPLDKPTPQDVFAKVRRQMQPPDDPTAPDEEEAPAAEQADVQPIDPARVLNKVNRRSIELIQGGGQPSAPRIAPAPTHQPIEHQAAASQQLPEHPEDIQQQLQEYHRTTGFLERQVDRLVRGWKEGRQATETRELDVLARSLRDFDQVDNGELDLVEFFARDTELEEGEGIFALDFSIGNERYNRLTEYMSATPAEREQIRRGLEEAIEAQAGDVTRRGKEIQLIPRNPAAIKLAEAETWGDAFDAFTQDPLGVIAELGLSSLPRSAKSLGFGAALGPFGAFMGARDVEYTASLLEGLGREGVDVSNPEALAAAVQDSALMERVYQRGKIRSNVIGAVDAASFGLAGKTLVPALQGRAASPLVEVAGQTYFQAGLGALGEAAGQAAAGDEIAPGEIIAEAAGELVQTPGEMLAAGSEAFRTARADQQQLTVRTRAGRRRVRKVLKASGMTPEEIDAAMSQLQQQEEVQRAIERGQAAVETAQATGATDEEAVVATAEAIEPQEIPRHLYNAALGAIENGDVEDIDFIITNLEEAGYDVPDEFTRLRERAEQTAAATEQPIRGRDVRRTMEEARAARDASERAIQAARLEDAERLAEVERALDESAPLATAPAGQAAPGGPQPGGDRAAQGAGDTARAGDAEARPAAGAEGEGGRGRDRGAPGGQAQEGAAAAPGRGAPQPGRRAESGVGQGPGDARDAPMEAPGDVASEQDSPPGVPPGEVVGADAGQQRAPGAGRPPGGRQRPVEQLGLDLQRARTLNREALDGEVERAFQAWKKAEAALARAERDLKNRARPPEQEPQATQADAFAEPEPQKRPHQRAADQTLGADFEADTSEERIEGVLAPYRAAARRAKEEYEATQATVARAVADLKNQEDLFNVDDPESDRGAGVSVSGRDAGGRGDGDGERMVSAEEAATGEPGAPQEAGDAAAAEPGPPRERQAAPGVGEPVPGEEAGPREGQPVAVPEGERVGDQPGDTEPSPDRPGEPVRGPGRPEELARILEAVPEPAPVLAEEGLPSALDVTPGEGGLYGDLKRRLVSLREGRAGSRERVEEYLQHQIKLLHAYQRGEVLPDDYVPAGQIINQVSMILRKIEIITEALDGVDVVARLGRLVSIAGATPADLMLRAEALADSSDPTGLRSVLSDMDTFGEYTISRERREELVAPLERMMELGATREDLRGSMAGILNNPETYSTEVIEQRLDQMERQAGAEEGEQTVEAKLRRPEDVAAFIDGVFDRGGARSEHVPPRLLELAAMATTAVRQWLASQGLTTSDQPGPTGIPATARSLITAVESGLARIAGDLYSIARGFKQLDSKVGRMPRLLRELNEKLARIEEVTGIELPRHTIPPARFVLDGRYVVFPSPEGLQVLNHETHETVGRSSSNYEGAIAEYFGILTEELDAEPRVADRIDVATPEHFVEAVLAESRNPFELLEAFGTAQQLAQERQLGKEGSVDDGIASWFEGGERVATSSAEAIGDPNILADDSAIRLNYLSSQGRALDVVAMELTTNTGVEVTPQDVWDFMLAYPGGPRAYRAEGTELVTQARQAFEEATGVTLTDSQAEAIYGAAYEQPDTDTQEAPRAPFARIAEPRGPDDGQQRAPDRPSRRAATATDRIAPAVAGFAREQGLPGVTVVEGPGELPAPVQRLYWHYHRQAGGMSTATAMLHEGEVYLLADAIERMAGRIKIDPARLARQAYLHEVVAHRGLRGLLGEGFDDVMVGLFDAASHKIYDAGLVDLYGDMLSTPFLDEFTDADKSLLMDEYLARLAEGLVRPEPSLLRTIFDMLKAALARLVGEVPDSDLQLLLMASADYLRAEQEGTSVGATRFMFVGAKAEGFIEGPFTFTGLDGERRVEISDAEARIRPRTSNETIARAADIASRGRTGQIVSREEGIEWQGYLEQWRVYGRSVAVQEREGRDVNLAESAPKALRLEDILDHERLYEQYPELARIVIIPTESVAGTMSQDQNMILMRPKNLQLLLAEGAEKPPGWDSVTSYSVEQMRGVLLHEIQHVVQWIEKWSVGSSMKMAHVELADQAIQNLVQRESWPGVGTEAGRVQMANEMKRLAGLAPEDPLQAAIRRYYEAASGEIEAERTRARAELTDDQRRLLTEAQRERMNALEEAARQRVLSDNEQREYRLLLREYTRLYNDVGARDHQMREIDHEGNLTLVRTLEDIEAAWARVHPYMKRANAAMQSRFMRVGAGYINVYHGTPYVFDRFSTQFIGEGEGAAAYGWGLYFSSSRGVAKWYAEQVSEQRAPVAIKGRKVFTEVLQWNDFAKMWDLHGRFVDAAYWLTSESVESFARAKEEALAQLRYDRGRVVEYRDRNADLLEEDVNRSSYEERRIRENVDDGVMMATLYDVAIEGVEAAEGPEDIEAPTRVIYNVRLHSDRNPGEWNYLDWDAPVDHALFVRLIEALHEEGHITEEDVSLQIGELAEETGMGYTRPDAPGGMGRTGQTLYHALEITLGGKKAASLWLLEHGIDGITYIGGTSDKRNYVVFDDEAVAIESSVRFARVRPDEHQLDMFATAATVESTDGQSAIESPLVALHNISEHGLKFADRLGGLPMPSLAITKPELVLDGFGEITLVAPRDVIDPTTDPRNRAFNADIYSPRIPKAERDVIEDRAEELLEELRTFARQFPGHEKRLADLERRFWGYTDDRNPRSVAQYLAGEDLSALFLLREMDVITQAELDALPRRRPTLNREEEVVNDPALRAYLEDYIEDGELDVRAITGGGSWHDGVSEPMTRIAELVSDAEMRMWQRLGIGKMVETVRRLNGLSDDLHAFKQYERQREVVRELAEDLKNLQAPDVIDWRAISITGRLGYLEREDAWIERVDSMYGEPRLVESRQPRRTVPYTLENIIRAMRREPIKGGEGFTFGTTGLIRALLADEFATVEEMKEQYPRLQESTEWQAIKDDLAERAHELATTMGSKTHSPSQHFGEVLADYVAGGPSIQSMRRALERNAINPLDVGSEWIAEAMRFTEALRSSPTDYFESKPQRVVSLNEFVAAAIPEGASPEVEQLLRKHGIDQVATYATKAERAEAIAAMQGIRFSRQPNPDQTHRPAFIEWFGDWQNNPDQASQVVDEDGRPQVMYHGTTASFTAPFGEIFLTDDPAVASAYADRQALMADERTEGLDPDQLNPQYFDVPRAGQNVMPFYVNARNPIDLTDLPTTVELEEAVELLQERGLVQDADMEFLPDFVGFDPFAPVSLFTVLEELDVYADIRAAGYDAVRLPDVGPAGQDHEALLVFSGRQLKSATGNRGTFNPDVEDIRFARMSEEQRERFRTLIEQERQEPGSVEGRPDLALPSASSDVRRVFIATDQLRNERGEPDAETFAEWKAEAEQLLASDYAGTRRRVFEDRDQSNPVLVMAGRMILEEETAEALRSGDTDRIEELALLAWSYRSARSDLARALAAGRDPLATPAERRRRIVGEAVLMPDQKTQRKLRDVEDRMSDTVDELQAAERRIEDIEAQARADQGAIEELTSEAQRRRLEAAQAEAERAAAERAALEAERDAAKSKASAAKELLRRRRQQLTRAEEDVETVEAQLNETERILKATKEGLADLRDEYQKMQRQRQRAQEKIQEARDRIAAGHGEQVQRIRAALQKQGIDLADLTDEQLQDPRVLWRIIRTAQAGKADIFDMAYEYWINAILSAPTTQAANIIGNTFNTVWELTIQRWTQLAVEVLLPGANRKTLAEAAGELKHLYQGLLGPTLRNAFRRFRLAWDTEMPVLAPELGIEDTAAKIERENLRAAIPGRTGRFVRAGFGGGGGRFLLAADELAKSIIWSMEVGAQAYRIALMEGRQGEDLARRVEQLTADPESEASVRAFARSKELTFQTELGAAGQAVIEARSHPKLRWLTFIIPFITAPSNIIKTGIRKSPLGLAAVAYRIGRAGFYKLGLSDNAEMVYTRSKLSRDLAEQLITSVAFLLLFDALAGDDDEEDLPLITGSGPDWTDQGELLLSRRALPPQSIRFGDTWVSYARIEPVATSLTVAVDMIDSVKRVERGEDLNAVLGDQWKNLVKLARDKTFLQGVGDIIRALEYPERGVPRWISNFGTSWLPNVIRSSARAQDDVFRDTRPKGTGEAFLESLGEQTLRRALPGMGHVMPWDPAAPSVDVWGRESEKYNSDRPTSDFLYRMFVPLWRQRTDRAHRLDQLLMRYNKRFPNDQYLPTLPRPSFTQTVGVEENGVRFERRQTVRLSDEEYYLYLKLAGARTLAMLEEAPLNYEEPTPREVEMIQTAIRDARRDVREVLLGVRAQGLRIEDLGEAQAVEGLRELAEPLLQPTP